MERPRTDANNCFVCGPDNEQGLQLSFCLEADDSGKTICVAEFTPAAHMIGYDDQVHGGILFSFLDDAMANYLFLQGKRAHTAKCEIRYRQPAKVGRTLKAEGWAVKEKGRLALMEGRITDVLSGEVIAETSASFMISG